MEITRAIARGLRVSPSKARLTARHIVGRNVGAAINMLTFSPRKSAQMLLRVVRSAVANAANNENYSDADNLVVSRVLVDQGPCLKRWRPRAQGRAYKIKKPMCHITVYLGEARK